MVKLLRSIRERVGTNRFQFGSRPVLFQPVSHQQLLASDMFVSRIEDQLMDRLLAEVLSYLRTCVVRAKLSLVNVFSKM